MSLDERHAPLVPRIAAPIVERASVVGTSDGNVLSAIVCVDNSVRFATFVARILNNSSEILYCSVYGETRRGLESVAPYEFRIGGFGIEDATIAVPHRLRRRFRRIIVSMRGRSLEYTMDANVPNRYIPPPLRVASVLAAILALVVVVRSGSISVGTVPDRVFTNQSVRIPYSAYGLGTVRYDVKNGNRPLAAGSLPLGVGVLTVDSGPNPGTLRSTFTLAQAGAERHADGPVVTVASPTPAPAPPQVMSFSIDRGQAQPGDRVNVSYRVSADSGQVRLLDESGAAVEAFPLSPSGETTMVMPEIGRAETYRVEVQATRNRVTTRVAASLLLAPAERPIGAFATNANLTATDIVHLAQPWAVAGSPLHIDILQRETPLRLELQDQLGRVIAQRDVVPGTDSVQMNVPPSTDTTLVLVITFNAAGADQSLLLPVPVRSR